MKYACSEPEFSKAAAGGFMATPLFGGIVAAGQEHPCTF